MTFDYAKRLVEITGEVDGFTYPAHTYYLNEAGKLVAFKQSGKPDIKVFNKPLAFDRRRRKFKELK